jgi:hypothetical protein
LLAVLPGHVAAAAAVHVVVIADGKSRVTLELPCLPLVVVTTMLGPELLAKASNGKKQLQV